MTEERFATIARKFDEQFGPFCGPQDVLDKFLQSVKDYKNTATKLGISVLEVCEFQQRWVVRQLANSF